MHLINNRITMPTIAELISSIVCVFAVNNNLMLKSVKEMIL